MKIVEMLEVFCRTHKKYKLVRTKEVFGILIPDKESYMKLLMELTDFLTNQGYEDKNGALEGTEISRQDDNVLVIFPAIAGAEK